MTLAEGYVGKALVKHFYFACKLEGSLYRAVFQDEQSRRTLNLKIFAWPKDVGCCA